MAARAVQGRSYGCPHRLVSTQEIPSADISQTLLVATGRLLIGIRIGHFQTTPEVFDVKDDKNVDVTPDLLDVLLKGQLW